MVDDPPPPLTLDDLFGVEERVGPSGGGPRSDLPLPTAEDDPRLPVYGVLDPPEPT